MRVADYKIQLPKFISMLIYGASDVGKTVLASCSDDLDPKELKIVDDAIMIDVEDGMLSLPTRAEGIIVERYPSEPGKHVRSIDNLDAALVYIRKNASRINYASLDSLDRFQELAIAEIVKSRGHDRPEMQDWGDLLYRLTKFGRELPTLGTNFIVTCHVEEARDAEEHVMKMMPNIQGSFRSKITSYFDVVGYYVKESEDERLLHLTGTKSFIARSRLGSCLTGTIRNPTIPKMIEQYTKKRAALIERLEKQPNITVIS